MVQVFPLVSVIEERPIVDVASQPNAMTARVPAGIPWVNVNASDEALLEVLHLPTSPPKFCASAELARAATKPKMHTTILICQRIHLSNQSATHDDTRNSLRNWTVWRKGFC